MDDEKKERDGEDVVGKGVVMKGRRETCRYGGNEMTRYDRRAEREQVGDLEVVYQVGFSVSALIDVRPYSKCQIYNTVCTYLASYFTTVV